VPERVAALAPAVHRVWVTDGNWPEVVGCEDPTPEVDVSHNALTALPYSSGTTGKPKGVMLTHSNIIANMRQSYGTGAARREDVWINMFPLYHAAGLICVLTANLWIGPMRRFELQGWQELNERYRATKILTPPPIPTHLSG
jgi:acyl-CoA synthetase (AMP-forming)/AMP-acid ligase II